MQEGRIEGWELDSCGDCWVSKGCLVDSNETSAAAVDAHMYRYYICYQNRIEFKTILRRVIELTLGGDPLDSSSPTPKIDMRAPNQTRAGTIAPNIPSSKGTIITC